MPLPLSLPLPLLLLLLLVKDEPARLRTGATLIIAIRLMVPLAADTTGPLPSHEYMHHAAPRLNRDLFMNIDINGGRMNKSYS